MNYDKYISEIAKGIKPSGIRKFFDVANSMKDAISLGVGEPDFVTPWSVRDAAITSIKRGYTQYTSNAGMPELREAISKYLSVRYNLTYDPNDEILVTVGASEGIDLALRALLNPNDEVLIPDPSYVSYAPCVTLCGGVPVSVNCVASNDFKVTPKDLKDKITDKTKVLIMPYPNNPTGAIMEKEHLLDIAKLCIENDIIVISDEIYSELTYDEVHTSIASLPNMRERTIVINGFSKAFAMTGWRLGYLACPREFLVPMYKIHQYGIMCAPTASQYAGLKALNDAFEDDFASVKEMHEEYDKRRRYLVHELNKMGLECFEPKGAFYVFPSVASTGMNGEEFANGLLMAKKVAVVPGNAFGENGNNFVRISYAYSMEKLKKAIKRIGEYLEELKAGKSSDGKKNNQQEVACNTPQEFFDSFYLNNNNSIIFKQTIKGHNLNIFSGMYGNYFVVKGSDDFVLSYYEYVNNSLIEYEPRIGKWKVSTITKEKIDALIGEVSQNKYMNTLFINCIMKGTNTKLFIDSVKETSNFEQKDGWYVGKETTNAKYYSYKLSNDELVIKFEDNGSPATFTFKKGCDEIIIPAEAKDAANN